MLSESFCSRLGLAALSAVAVTMIGCASGPEPVAFTNKVFYQYDKLGNKNLNVYEAHYAPLDQAQAAPLPEYMGVSVLDAPSPEHPDQPGGNPWVHLSRPRDWVIRAASNQPEHRFIEYVSPNEYMVAVYELVESPDDPWLDILTRYEDQAKKAGADFLGQRIPMATTNTQGRGYLVRRPVAAAKAPLLNYSNEYILRNDRRIALLQIVHHDKSLVPVDAELRRVIETLELE